jgi:hypothetical protein
MMRYNIGVIKKVKGKYVVMSENTGRSFGAYKTMSEAKHRLAQVEFFKHLAEHPGIRKGLRKKSL